MRQLSGLDNSFLAMAGLLVVANLAAVVPAFKARRVAAAQLLRED